MTGWDYGTETKLKARDADSPARANHEANRGSTPVVAAPPDTAEYTPRGYPILAAQGDGKTAAWSQGFLTWEALLNRLESPAGRKECGGYVPGDFGGDGPRRRARIASRWAITLDYDGGDLASVVDRLRERGHRAAWHTSYNHRQEKAGVVADRFRVVVPLDRPVSADEYPGAARALAAALGTEGLDERSYLPEQFMYWPAAADPGAYEFGSIDGRLSPAEALPDWDGEVPGIDRLPPTAELMKGIPESHRDDYLFRLGCRLVDQGVEQDVLQDMILSAADRSGFPGHEAMKCIEQAEQYRTAATPDEAVDQRVQAALERLRIHDRARELRAAELADAAFAALPPADAGTLADMLARDPEPPARIRELLPDLGNMVVSAQNKTGKTTYGINLARCLLTGDPFLERFEVRPIDGMVAVWNYEVSGPQFARWANENGCPTDRVYIENLRGRPSPLASPAARERARADLVARGCQVLIVDPFGRAFHGDEQNSNSEVQRWLNLLDEFAHDAGIQHVILATHAGWSGEHSRGASALEGWPDSIVRLVKDDHQKRYLSAEGRDVDVPESLIEFHEGSRRLRLTNRGNRKVVAEQVNSERLVGPVVEFVTENPGSTQNKIETGTGGKGTTLRKAIQLAVQEGSIRIEKVGQAHRHYAVEDVIW